MFYILCCQSVGLANIVKSGKAETKPLIRSMAPTARGSTKVFPARTQVHPKNNRAQYHQDKAESPGQVHFHPSRHRRLTGSSCRTSV